MPVLYASVFYFLLVNAIAWALVRSDKYRRIFGRERVNPRSFRLLTALGAGLSVNAARRYYNIGILRNI